MSEIKDGGPAFPVMWTEIKSDEEGPQITACEPGMTLRDYFASRAIHAVLTSPRFENCYDAALMAYRMADAMLRARSQS